MTGPGGCSLVMGGERSQAVMLTRVGEESEISVSGAAGTCDLTLLVVGGGGHDSPLYGGAGSGHLEYRSLQVAAGTVLTARVGYQGQASSLAISGGDTSDIFSFPLVFLILMHVHAFSQIHFMLFLISRFVSKSSFHFIDNSQGCSECSVAFFV